MKRWELSIPVWRENQQFQSATGVIYVELPAHHLKADRIWRKSLKDWHKDVNEELPAPRDFSELGAEVTLPISLWLGFSISEIASLLKMDVETPNGLEVGWIPKVKNTTCILGAYKMTVTKERSEQLSYLLWNHFHAAPSNHV